MEARRVIRPLLGCLGAVLLLAAALFAAGWWYLHPAVTRTDGIVYGQRHGQPLAIDVLRPASPNGRAVLIMVSGSWKSKPAGRFELWIAAPLLRQGYTVFPVYHVSQPKASIPEIVADVNRAVRFVRHHARQYGVDPRKIGVTGGSSGGHLCLMLATRGGPGPADAPDPVDRESSAVQAVAIFFPVTNLIDLGRSTENLRDGGPPKSYRKAFGIDPGDLAAWKIVGRDVSPVFHVTRTLPPVLIAHGDADTLTPLEQSEWFQARAREVGREVVIEVHRGGKHGWRTMPWDVRRFGIWFDAHLR